MAALRRRPAAFKTVTLTYWQKASTIATMPSRPLYRHHAADMPYLILFIFIFLLGLVVSCVIT
jgi:hypothetical protein